jgi:SAM-dependent methyltransferase
MRELREMKPASNFWDAMAPHHAKIENNYLDLRSIRRIVRDIREPVLIVGAGQGLIVEELIKNGLKVDGLDLSPEMIRFARARRGLDFVHADARAMPFGAGTYQTIIYATGVIDFMGDDEVIDIILREARRVVNPSGTIFVAFYQFSPGLQDFMIRLGLLRGNFLNLRETLEIYRLNGVQTIAWVAKRAGVGYLRAAMLALRSALRSTMRENRAGFQMQRIFRNLNHASSLINSAPEKQPYRNEQEIKNLFERLGIKIKKTNATGSCFMVEV